MSKFSDQGYEETKATGQDEEVKFVQRTLGEFK